MKIEYKKIEYFYWWRIRKRKELQLFLYCDIQSENEIDIKINYGKIDKEVKYISAQINNDKNYNLTPDHPLNLVVLTANPLVHGKEKLRIINDFNILFNYDRNLNLIWLKLILGNNI